MQKGTIKRGPKPKTSYICTRCNREFETARKKSNHYCSEKKSKTQFVPTLGENSTSIEVFGTQMKTKKNIFTLGETGAFSKFKQQNTLKNVTLKDKIIINMPLGPNSILNPEDILIEENPGEEKEN